MLGAEHLDTLTSMMNLASTYSNQGRSDDAKKLLMRVMEISKTVDEVKHSSTPICRVNLAETDAE